MRIWAQIVHLVSIFYQITERVSFGTLGVYF